MAIICNPRILASSISISLFLHLGSDLGTLLGPVSEHVLAKLVGVHLGSWVPADELDRVKVRLQRTGRLLHCL